jgi:hypothetical protein
MARRKAHKDRPECIPHGPGCDLKLAACRVYVDPDSDPALHPCWQHDKYCNLRRSTCRRRLAKCDCAIRLDLLVAVDAEARAKLDGEDDPDRLHAIGDAAIADYAAEHTRQHDEDGRPRADHPKALSKAQEAALLAGIAAQHRELVAARERDRAAREAALVTAHPDPVDDQEGQDPELPPRPQQVAQVVPINRPRRRPHPNQPRTIMTQIGDDDD